MNIVRERTQSPHPRASEPAPRPDGDWAVEVHGLTKHFGIIGFAIYAIRRRRSKPPNGDE